MVRILSLVPVTAFGVAMSLRPNVDDIRAFERKEDNLAAERQADAHIPLVFKKRIIAPAARHREVDYVRRRRVARYTLHDAKGRPVPSVKPFQSEKYSR